MLEKAILVVILTSSSFISQYGASPKFMISQAVTVKLAPAVNAVEARVPAGSEHYADDIRHQFQELTWAKAYVAAGQDSPPFGAESDGPCGMRSEQQGHG